MIEKFYINKRASEFAYWETEITNEQPDNEKEFSLCLVKHSDYEALLRQLEQLKEECGMMKNCQNCKWKTTPLGQYCSRPNKLVPCWRKPMSPPQMNSMDFWEAGI